eukprot:scaffold241027_cov44-Attheya_sp.AAC.1
MGGFLCAYLIEGDISFWIIGGTMFVVHMMTAFLTWKLPETKGLDLGESQITSMDNRDEPMSGGGDYSNNSAAAVRPKTTKQNHSLGPHTGLFEMNNQGSKSATSYSELL